jgi:hypothetical protein
MIVTSPPTAPAQLASIALRCACNEAEGLCSSLNASIDPDCLIEVVRHFVNDKMESAVTDAQQAWEAGGLANGVLAEVLFMGHMKLAGIEAAKYVMGLT